MTDCFLFLYLFFNVITVSKSNIEVKYLSTFSNLHFFPEKIFAKNSFLKGIDLFARDGFATCIFNYFLDEVTNTIVNQVIINKEYFSSDQEFIISYDKSIFYYNDYKTVGFNFKFSIEYIYDFTILKDNSTVVIYGSPAYSSLLINRYNYPPTGENNYNLTIFIEYTVPAIQRLMSIIECSNMIFVFTHFKYTNNIHLYIIDILLTKIYSEKSITGEEISNFKLTHLDENRNNIAFCFIENHKIKCNNAKYEKKIYLGEFLEIFSFLSYQLNYDITSFEDNKIAVIIYTTNYIYLSTIKFNGNSLEFDTFKNKIIINNNEKYMTLYHYFVLNFNKNYGLNIFLFSRDTNIIKIYKASLFHSCKSLTIDNIVPNIKNLIDFSKLVSKGIEGEINKLYLYSIDKEIELYKNNNKILSIFNFTLNDKIHAIIKDRIEPFKLFFGFENMKCQISLISEKTFIKIMDQSHRCLISQKKQDINNIEFHDLNDKKIDINVKFFLLNIIFEKSIINAVLNFYFLNKTLFCQKDDANDKKITCLIPLQYKLEKIFYKNISVYSKLSCTNLIEIGNRKIKSDYLLNIYEAKNLSKITTNINKKYDPSEKIKNFSVDMISYYLWFSSFAYCDDIIISSGKCCKNQILKNWKVIEHHEYEREQIIKKHNNIIKYKYNFVILKSEKYKKYVFAFPGTEYAFQFLDEIVYSDLYIIDQQNEIKVSKYFYYIFNLIYKDVFSESIIRDLQSNPDYQVIFTGHSLGGAISTLISYYYASNIISSNEPILITFGQPRVGNENFARSFNKYIPLIFRIARINDVVTKIPLREKEKEIKILQNLKKKFYTFLYERLNYENFLIYSNIVKILEKEFISKIDIKIGFGYCHIGGLYVLNNNKFYQCSDFYNEETGHPICNNEYKNIIKKNGNLEYILKNHGYLNIGEDLLSKCQKRKKFKILEKN